MTFDEWDHDDQDREDDYYAERLEIKCFSCQEWDDDDNQRRCRFCNAPLPERRVVSYDGAN